MTPPTSTNGHAPSAALRALRRQALFAPLAALWSQLQARLDGAAALGITASRRGEGSTTVAANLAMCAAAATARPVLLVDAHPSSARLAQLFGLAPQPGLAELLQGRCELDDCVQATPVAHLHLLAAGTGLLEFIWNRPALAQAFDQLRQRYGLSVCDLAPVSSGASPAALGSCLDGVLLVLQTGRTQTELARRAKEQLERAQARLLGIVLNQGASR